jgi:hypothetical protein
MRGGDVRRSVLLAVLAAAAIAAVATVAPRFGGGTEQVEAQDGASLSLDMDITNGSGPCNPIDPEGGSSGNGADFKVAICLTGSAVPPAAIDVRVIYDDTLDQCVPVDCPSGECLDANPDANAGTTTWTTPGLGTGCDCSSAGGAPPACDRNPNTGPGEGVAFISCVCATPKLPVGPTVSIPIAVVTFKNIAKGKDTFSFGASAAYTEDGKNIVRCASAQCLGGARVESLSAPLTPTPGGVPPTGTAGASGSASPTARPGATPGEEKGEGEGGGTNAVLIAVIVIGAVVVVGGVGWFAYRRLRLR